MRILYVEANEDGTVGGSHKILFDLVTRLSPSFEPVVLFYQENIWASRLRGLGVEVVTWDDIRKAERGGIQNGGKLSTAVTLARGISRRRSFIRDQRIDLVHLNNSPFVGFDDWLPASRLSGVPCVVYGMGDLQYEPNPVRRWGISKFDAYFPLSVLVQDAFLRNGIPAERMTLAYPGVDLASVDARTFRTKEEVRAEFGLEPGQLLVSMVGNIRRWKGQDVVIEALSRLSPQHRQAIYVIFVGQGDEEHRGYEQELIKAIGHHELQGVVNFIGRREDVPDLLEASDIAVHASIAPEPFGLVVQEAMLHGCATVAADEGGPVEMMTPESGLMFDTDKPAELTYHFRTLINDAAMREDLSRAARQQARTFDVYTHVETIETGYSRLLT